MAIDGQAFERRYTLYFDFLGTRNALSTWQVKRLHEFVDLLRSLVAMRGPQEIDGKPREDGAYTLSIRPEVSTFSDHIVLSYPELGGDDERFWEMVGPLWVEFICRDCLRLLSPIAEKALRQGLLLRGGLTVGELFHDGDVVFGDALVEAHEIESKAAKNPRVVVSASVISQFKDGPAAHPDILLQDGDGLWHLNYFARMRQQGVSPDNQESVLRWNAAMRQIVESNLSATSEGAHEKWVWFKNRLEAVL
jgi:hypothetical protein